MAASNYLWPALFGMTVLPGCATINIFTQQEVRLNGQRLIFARLDHLGPMGHGRVSSWSYDRGKFIIEAEDGLQVNGVEIHAGRKWVRIANHPLALKEGEAVEFEADMSRWRVVPPDSGR